MKTIFIIIISFSQASFANGTNNNFLTESPGAAGSCTNHEGRTLEHGQKYFVYKNEFAPKGGTCEDIIQERECVNGVITGSYIHEFCAEKKSCEIEGSFVEHGMEVKLYREALAREFPKCEHQVRMCNDGELDGTDDFTYAYCQTPKEKGETIAKVYKDYYKMAKKSGSFDVLNQPVFKEYQRQLREQALETTRDQ